MFAINSIMFGLPIACSPVGESCRRGIVVRPIVPSEGVILTWITVDRYIRFVGKRRLDLSLRSLGNELVLLGQMHQQRRIKPIDLAQIFLSVTAVIGDRSIDAMAHGRQEGHQPAEA